MNRLFYIMHVKICNKFVENPQEGIHDHKLASFLFEGPTVSVPWIITGIRNFTALQDRWHSYLQKKNTF